jgi:hypothetical protein
MWRRLEDLIQKADEHFPRALGDMALALGAAVLITFIVRIVVG